MIVFSCFDTEYFNTVFLTNKTIYLSLFHSPSLDKFFLCMEAHNSGYNKPFNLFRSRYLLVPDLENYKALPYKKQSFVDRLDKKSSISYSALPWFENCNSLSKIKGFYLNCKKCYVVIVYRKISGNEEDEKVAVIFDRYSDAISALRDFRQTKIRRLLGNDFESCIKSCNSWHPYIWVDYVNHPISLLGKISSYNRSYELGAAWCDFFLCFLKDGFVRDGYFNSLFGFIQKENFSQIIHYKEQL